MEDDITKYILNIINHEEVDADHREELRKIRDKQRTSPARDEARAEKKTFNKFADRKFLNSLVTYHTADLSPALHLMKVVNNDPAVRRDEIAAGMTKSVMELRTLSKKFSYFRVMFIIKGYISFANDDQESVYSGTSSDYHYDTDEENKQRLKSSGISRNSISSKEASRRSGRIYGPGHFNYENSLGKYGMQNEAFVDNWKIMAVGLINTDELKRENTSWTSTDPDPKRGPISREYTTERNLVDAKLKELIKLCVDNDILIFDFKDWNEGLVEEIENKIQAQHEFKRLTEEEEMNEIKDRIPGGKADDKSPEDFDSKELKKGKKVEGEHTSDDGIATEIAMDHLEEDPEYYEKLEKFHIDESSRYSREKGEKFNPLKDIEQYIDDPWVLFHKSEINKLGINPKQHKKYSTPFGIYFYPLTKDYWDMFKRINGQELPFNPDMNFTHFVKIKEEYRDKIVVINEHGQVSGPRIDIYDENIDQEIMDRAIEDVDEKYDSDHVQEFLNTLSNEKKSNTDKTSQAEYEQNIKSYKVRSSKNIPTEFHYFFRYLQLLSATNKPPSSVENPNAVDVDAGDTDIVKWTKLLLKYGIYGIRDDGTGMIHPNEPYQIVLFSKKIFEPLITAEKDEIAARYRPKPAKKTMPNGDKATGFLYPKLMYEPERFILHSFKDEPALITPKGTKTWYKKGKKHRDGDKPAYVGGKGTKAWYKNGQLHRDGEEPAVIKHDGTIQWYQNGRKTGEDLIPDEDLIYESNNKELSEEFLLSTPISFADMKHDDQTVRESMLNQFGSLVMMILKRMFTGTDFPGFKVRGTSDELRAFARSLDAERNYMNTYTKHGLTDPSTLRSKRDLEKWISKFEKQTGVKWPIK